MCVSAVFHAAFRIYSFSAKFQYIVEPAIPQLIHIAKNDDDEDVRAAGMKLVASLAKDGGWDLVIHIYASPLIIRPDKLQSIIKLGLLEILDSGQKDTNWKVRAAWAEIQVTLAQNGTFLPHLLESLDPCPIFFPADFQVFVESGIPGLVEMAMNDINEGARAAGVKSLVSLARHGVLNACLALTIPFILIHR